MWFINFILYLVLIYIGIKVLWFFFGPFILKMIVRRLAKKMQDDFVRTQNAHQNTYQNKGIQISPNARLDFIEAEEKATHKPDLNNLAKDVEYEEIKEE